MFFIKTGGHAKTTALHFNLDTAFFSRDLNHILPICEVRNTRVIYLFDEFFLSLTPKAFGHGEEEVTAHGLIDCSCRQRDRVHPGQKFFYRTDKKMHFIASQVVTNFAGKET